MHKVGNPNIKKLTIMKILFVTFFTFLSININSQNTFPANGNVGIGTTSPSAKLHVAGNGAIIKLQNTIYEDTENEFYGWLGGYDKSGDEIWWLGEGSSGDKTLGFYVNRLGYDMNLYVNGKGMTIKNSGNIGIGTTNPQTLLNVNVGNGGANGTAGIRVGGTDNYSSLEFGIDGAYDGMIRSFGNNLKYYAGHWKVIGNTASENHNHTWYTSKAGSNDWSTVKMILNENGYLGIGTTNPEQKLTLNGGEFSISDGGSGLPFKIWAGGNDGENHMRIGTDFGHYGDSAIELYQNYSGGSAQNPGKVIVNGNLGVGTRFPDSKLTVKGKIHSEEVKVDLSVPAPDYVFKEDYNLRTLEETQKYIKENGHLPNIPSAKEMEENGVELGVMNMKLLEKIEELTLYILEQEKRIKKLENEK